MIGPYRAVVRLVASPMGLVELLECGHQGRAASVARRAKRRRCPKCGEAPMLPRPLAEIEAAADRLEAKLPALEATR